MSEEKAKWYVVHTYSGYENKVKLIFKRLWITEIYITGFWYTSSYGGTGWS